MWSLLLYLLLDNSCGLDCIAATSIYNAPPRPAPTPPPPLYFLLPKFQFCPFCPRLIFSFFFKKKKKIIPSGAFSTCNKHCSIVKGDRRVTCKWWSTSVYLIVLSMGSGVGVLGHFLRRLCSTTFHSWYIPVRRLPGTVGEHLATGVHSTSTGWALYNRTKCSVFSWGEGASFGSVKGSFEGLEQPGRVLNIPWDSFDVEWELGSLAVWPVRKPPSNPVL